MTDITGNGNDTPKGSEDADAINPRHATDTLDSHPAIAASDFSVI